MASQPQTIGLSGVQVVFVVDGIYYQTAAANAIGMTADQAASLIATGDAVPQAESYLTQFPWLYVENSLQTEANNVGENSETLVTENNVPIWA